MDTAEHRSTDLAGLTIAEAASLLATRQLSPVDLTEAALERTLPGKLATHEFAHDAARAAVSDAVRRAGLALSARQFDLVCAAARHVAAMLARLRRPRRFNEEPANTLSLPA